MTFKSLEGVVSGNEGLRACGTCGIAASAVRWYESVGILPEPSRQANGYREYVDDDLARLRLVVSLRRLGLGPEDAGESRGSASRTARSTVTWRR